MIKADGCVAIHADGGAYKPLNWMNAPNRLSEQDDLWTVVNPAGEKLTITIHELISDTAHELGHDPGLDKDGVEVHLQELLAASPEVLGDGFRLVRREYPTDIGPVDLLCRDADGRAIAVEVKRRGEIAGVEQLTRYLQFLNQDPALGAGAGNAGCAGRPTPGPGSEHRPGHRMRGNRLRPAPGHRTRPGQAVLKWNRVLPSACADLPALPGSGPSWSLRLCSWPRGWCSGWWTPPAMTTRPPEG